MIIDFYIYCFLDDLVLRVMLKFLKNFGMLYYYDGILLGLKEFVKKVGIDMCVVLFIVIKF